MKQEDEARRRKEEKGAARPFSKHKQKFGIPQTHKAFVTTTATSNVCFGDHLMNIC